MNKPLIILILSILFLGSCSPGKYKDYQQKIVGTWEDADGFTWFFIETGYLIYLKGDGKEEYREYGYDIEGNKLFLSLPGYFNNAGLTQVFFIKISADGKTLNLKRGPYVFEWEVAGAGWEKIKLTKISDNIDRFIELDNQVHEALFGKEKEEFEPGSAFNDINFTDKYGNLVYQYDKRNKVNYSLLYTPDIDLLLQLKNSLFVMTINNKKIKDISFLKNLPQLKELYISESDILSLEPLKYLENLETLSIAGGFPGTIDCSVLRELKNLKMLDLGDNKTENIGAIAKIASYNLEVKGIKGYTDYLEKHRDLSGSESYVLHYDKYHIIQNDVNIKSKPSESGNTVAKLNLHDEIQIIEYTDKEEKINDIWGYWYKIKYKKVTGYIFGGYIAAETLITDIDKNGKKDYFYLLYASSDMDIEPDRDIKIYINDQKIDTGVLSATERSFNGRPFDKCIFEEGDGDVLIGLSQYGRHDYEYMHIFKVLPDGKIEYVQNWDEIDYW